MDFYDFILLCLLIACIIGLIFFRKFSGLDKNPQEARAERILKKGNPENHYR